MKIIFKHLNGPFYPRDDDDDGYVQRKLPLSIELQFALLECVVTVTRQCECMQCHCMYVIYLKTFKAANFTLCVFYHIFKKENEDRATCNNVIFPEVDLSCK